MKRKRKAIVTVACLLGACWFFGADWPVLPVQASDVAAPLRSASPSRTPAQPPMTPGTSSGSASAAFMYAAIQAGDKGQTVVRIATTKNVRFVPFRLSSPPRLVIDLEQTSVRRFQKVVPSEAGAVKDVRIAQFRADPSPVARVVADLSNNSPFRITSLPDGLQIEFDDKNDSPRPAPAVARKSLLRIVPPRPEQRFRSSSHLPSPPAVVNLTRPVKLDLSELTTHRPKVIPTREQQPAPSAAVFDPARKMAVRRLGETAAVMPASYDPPALSATQPAIQSLPGVETPPSGLPNEILATPFVKTGPSRYTGKRISLDLREVDIQDFFRLIHRISGLNLVVDPDVQGKITMVMNDVPWDEALELVLKNNGLGETLEDNVVRIAKQQTLTAEAQEQAERRKDKLSAEPLVTIVRPLQYARAADQLPTMATGGQQGGTPQIIPGVVTILNAFKGSVLSADGKAEADPRDNAVIVTDHLSQIPIIEKFIDNLDTRSKQVSIQVRVILANANFSRTLSSALSGALRNPSGSTQGGIGVGNGSMGTFNNVAPPIVGSNAINTQTVTNGIALGTVTYALPSTATGFGAFAITNAGARYIINAAISAAEEHDQARTISRPTIVTQNNVLGEVQQGVQIPIQTNINNTIAVQYVNATLQLSVTPQVTVDNKVFLNIYVNNASVGTLSTVAGPSINTQQATTQVLVPNGGTVVFGGITVTTRSRSATYVPLLGSIPIIGNLFKSSQVNDQNQELLFFVSPTILHS